MINPLSWRREQLVAWGIITLIGAILGLVFGWFQSPFYVLTHGTVSGEWANSTRIFVWWVGSPTVYWIWPFLGALLAALAFYAARLLRG